MSGTQAIYDTIVSQALTHEQKLMQLAHHAEDMLQVLPMTEKTRHYLHSGALCDLFEGAAPYRPRYILPDYARYLKQGSAFLKVAPPRDLDEVLNALMILYRHVPSITNFPVYLGNLDELIEPFLDGLSDENICKKLRLFLNYLDRTITDSFCHANLGPAPTRAGELLLRVERELGNAVPNFTIKYDAEQTPDAFMKLALESALTCSNPAVCNHAASRAVFGDRYGIASCYNILPTGGGAYTLSRITLTELVREAESTEHFLQTLLPDCLETMADYMKERIRFLVELSGFFESNFLAREGLVERERFIGMFGVTGLAECVNALMPQGKKYGSHPDADALGHTIMAEIERFAAAYEAEYSPLTGQRYLLHAQVGLEKDIGITSGVRIPVGDEPPSFADHLRHSASYHRYFTCGVGDIFPIGVSCMKNLDALLDVVKGAVACGVKYLSFYVADTDLVRITGYLVKRSEMEKYRRHEAVLQGTTQLGAPNYDNNRLAERRVRML